MRSEILLELICHKETACHWLAWGSIVVHGCSDVELFANDAHGGDVQGGHLQLTDFFACLVVLFHAGTAPNSDVKISLVIDVHAVGVALAFDRYDVLVKGRVSIVIIDVSAYFAGRGIYEEHIILVESDAVGNACSANKNLGSLSVVTVQGALFFLEAFIAGGSQKEPALRVFLSVVITDLRIVNQVVEECFLACRNTQTEYAFVGCVDDVVTVLKNGESNLASSLECFYGLLIGIDEEDAFLFNGNAQKRIQFLAKGGALQQSGLRIENKFGGIGTHRGNLGF